MYFSGGLFAADKADTNPYCIQTLSAIDREIFQLEDHETIRRIMSVYGKIDRQALRAKMMELTGYEMEPVPFVLDREIYDRLQAASKQRIAAARMFLKDIYSSEDPEIYKVYPQLRYIVETNPYFAKEAVGTEMARTIDWDFVLAMDWVIRKNPDGTLGISILESDSGSIGGYHRLAFVHEALIRAWGDIPGFDQFEDVRDQVHLQIQQHLEKARRFGNGSTILYTEADNIELFGPGSGPHPLKDWLAEANIPLVSNWNRNWNDGGIEYDKVAGLYTYKGEPISSWYFRYYTSSLDPSTPLYNTIGTNYKNEFELSHAIPEFWKHYMEGGFKRWYMLNAIGSEVFVDKGTSAFIPQMINFYLRKLPIINDTPYQLFINEDGSFNPELLKEVSKDRANFVVKSRAESGQGGGVFIGQIMPGQTKKHGLTWNQMIEEVRKNPVGYVVQGYFEEYLLKTADGELRSIEGRNIAWTSEGKPYTVDPIYIRSGPPGETRNLTGQEGTTSIIPVVVEKEK